MDNKRNVLIHNITVDEDKRTQAQAQATGTGTRKKIRRGEENGRNKKHKRPIKTNRYKKRL